MVIDVRATLRVLMPIVSTVSIRREAADRAARSSPRPAPDLRSTRCPPTRPPHLVYETSAGDVRVAVGRVARCPVRADAAGARSSRASRGTCEAFADDVSEPAPRVHRGRPAGSAPYMSATTPGEGSRIASGRRRSAEDSAAGEGRRTGRSSPCEGRTDSFASLGDGPRCTVLWDRREHQFAVCLTVIAPVYTARERNQHHSEATKDARAGRTRSVAPGSRRRPAGLAAR